VGLDDITLRPAVVDDADALSVLSTESYAAAFGRYFQPDDLVVHLDEELSPGRWRGYLAQDRVLVCDAGGALVGYLQLTPARGGIEINRVYVAPDRIGQGIGSRLLTAALDLPEVRAADAVWIEVWEENHGARRLYERFGFVDTGERGADFVTASGEVSPGDLIMVRRPIKAGATMAS
jgi:ribosomal protein S18 acetylase RimI-like enzyme